MRSNEKQAAIAGAIGLTFGAVSVWITSDSFVAALATVVIGASLGTVAVLLIRSYTNSHQ
ncbi:hypothetical protein [Rhodococcus sp. 1168]|uniref:hypothetical protein n=1 Tax=Rhodococcus sp. 1168 TaxID=2018041 RepID=UPI000A0DE359|nr:hypothetical protein [Rhodococcus sp. 1168]ORI22639.1 hypothetical protein BJI47_18745 [Rhodococcus sp. 1168]